MWCQIPFYHPGVWWFPFLQIPCFRFPKVPGLPKRPYLLKKDNKDLIGALVAKEWLTLVKIGAWVFEGFLTNTQIKCWNYHTKYLEALRQLELTKVQLDKMLDNMKKCHVLMYFLYHKVEIQAPASSGTKSVDASLDNKPNFHVGCHWEWYILEYGMPKWWDSERHENKHQDAIHDVRLTSGRADEYEQLIKKERRYVEHWWWLLYTLLCQMSCA